MFFSSKHSNGTLGHAKKYGFKVTLLVKTNVKGKTICTPPSSNRVRVHNVRWAGVTSASVSAQDITQRGGCQETWDGRSDHLHNKWEEEKTFSDDLDSKTADHSHQQGKEVGGRQRRCIRSNSSFLLHVFWNNDLKYYLSLVSRLKSKEMHALYVFFLHKILWALLKTLIYKYNYYSKKKIKERFCCKIFLKDILFTCHGCHCHLNF